MAMASTMTKQDTSTQPTATSKGLKRSPEPENFQSNDAQPHTFTHTHDLEADD
jgi:hypothetical protein